MLLSLFFILIFLFSVYIFCRKRADKYGFKHYENSQILKKNNREIKRLKDKENVDEIEKLQSKKRLHEELAIKLKKKEKNSLNLVYHILGHFCQAISDSLSFFLPFFLSISNILYLEHSLSRTFSISNIL